MSSDSSPMDVRRARILAALKATRTVHTPIMGQAAKASVYAMLGGSYGRSVMDELVATAPDARIDLALAFVAPYLASTEIDKAKMTLGDDERAAIAMARGLRDLRTLVYELRLAFDESVEVRIADALRAAMADLIESMAIPGSPEMAEARATKRELSPQPEKDTPA